MSAVPTTIAQAGAPAPAIRAALPLYAATIALSAFLLFSVQPLFAKLVLPVLGGSPAVWSVATVVFQCLLLAGYAYAHLVGGLAPRIAYPVHLAVLGAAALALPIALPAGWNAAPAGWEAPWLAALVTLSIGLPFFAVAANGPLLQAWFARTGHRAAGDPYFLYAASNLGSFAALAAYPFLVEPALRLADQTRAWATGFGALAFLVAAAGLAALRGRPLPEAEAAPAGAAPATPVRTVLLWIGLSAVPSGLLVAATAHISTDLAPIPLLWLLPLGLYLLSFVVAFRPGRLLEDARLGLPRVGLTCVALGGMGRAGSLELMLAVHLGLFALTALVCHRLLFRLRPDPRRLTGFYLALSVGGALGGLFCGLVAPLVFDTMAEYPLVLLAALACRPDLAAAGFRRDGLRVLAICTLAVAVAFAASFLVPPRLALNVLIAALAVLAIVRWRSAAIGLVAVGTIALVSTWPALTGTRTESRRSFFGEHRILHSDDGRFRILAHGTTMHGAVRIAKDDGSPATGRPEPTSYYGFGQVIGQAIEAVRGTTGGHLARVSAVGLGTGSLACHARPGESWTFHEIDGTVAAIARERFPFLSACGPDIPVVLGDARLTLGAAAGDQDLIVLDAFSSDAVPVHLLTREALGLYLSRLAPRGAIAVHISNRYLDLSHVLARTAAEHGLYALVGIDRDLGPDTVGMRAAAKVMLLARDEATFAPLAGHPSWSRLRPDPGRRPWTDDFSNVLEAFRDALAGRRDAER